jgi:hypothetical protein
VKIDPDLDITETEIYALRALRSGTANADQQRIGMQCIGVKLCGLFEPEYVPGIDLQESAHRSGRRYVGLLIGIMDTPEVLAHARAKAAQVANRTPPRRPRKPRGTP